MSLAKSIKEAGLWAVLSPLGYILAILGFLGIVVGGGQMLIDFSLMAAINAVVGFIMLILGIGVIRYRDDKTMKR